MFIKQGSTVSDQIWESIWDMEGESFWKDNLSLFVFVRKNIEIMKNEKLEEKSLFLLHFNHFLFFWSKI